MEPLTPKQLASYFSGKYYHPCHKEAVEKACALRVHADGTYPENLLEDRRPHETDIVREYRKSIWKAITKPTFNKVLNSLAKIRRSTEWSVKFGEAPPVTIIPSETLEVFINHRIPQHTSLTNWAFSVLLREYCIDANAWIAVIPTEDAVADGARYIVPRPLIFRSEQVIDFGDDFLVVLSGESCLYEEYVRNSKTKTHSKEGDVYYIITDTFYQKWEQTSSNRDFTMVWEYTHNIGMLPAFQMKGVVTLETEKRIISETRLAAMLPQLDEAAREYSDLQAEVVQHVYSEKWEMGQRECTYCHGSKTVHNDGHELPCLACKGTGWEPRGPYTTLMIDKPMSGETTTPIPPAGYVQKDTAIVELQDKRVQGHLFYALAAVNMEFLSQVPVAESGIAKAYDADEVNNFVHSVAEDLVAMLDSVIYYINELRYSIVVPDYSVRVSFLPTITVPDQFDLFSAKMIEAGLASAKTSNVNPVIINALEEEYANKKFSNNPSVRAKVSLTLSLDPLSGVSEDNKSMMLSNGGITKQTYVLSCNIGAYIARAVEEYGMEFLAWSVAEQREVLEGYAAEQVAAASPARQISNTFVPNSL